MSFITKRMHPISIYTYTSRAFLETILIKFSMENSCWKYTFRPGWLIRIPSLLEYPVFFYYYALLAQSATTERIINRSCLSLVRCTYEICRRISKKYGTAVYCCILEADRKNLSFTSVEYESCCSKYINSNLYLYFLFKKCSGKVVLCLIN